MLSIQEVGRSILTNNPNNLYMFVGHEYGIKDTYLSHLKDYYQSYREVDKMSDIIRMFSTKRLIASDPELYIIRYDEDFISNLDAKLSNKVKSLDIVGTVVCLYESSNSEAKLSKYLPEYTVSIDEVSSTYLLKYLKSEFSSIPDTVLRDVVLLGTNYQDCRNMCYSLSNMSSTVLQNLSKADLASTFGKNTNYTEKLFKDCIMSRNYFKALCMVESEDVDADSRIYAIMSAMIELEKILSGSKISDNYKKYREVWDLRSVYNMFMNCYDQIRKSRYGGTTSKNSLLYLVYLLRFKNIPSVEDL